MEKEKYIIRPLNPKNAKKIVNWNEGGSQDFLMQWAGRAFVHPITVEQVVADMKVCNTVFEIIYEEEMIGTIAFINVDEKTGSAYIGHFLLNPELKGQGHGTTILQEFIIYCFGILKLKELTLKVFDNNKGALRCYEKKGFKETERIKLENGLEVLTMSLKKKGMVIKMDISIKRDGLTLRGRLDKSTESNSNAAILFHGFGCDRGIEPDSAYQKITEELNKKGIAVFRFDFNGHGKSDGNFSNMNIWNEIEDAIAILEYVRAQEWVKEIFLMGHSQGGVIAGMMAGYYADVISRLVLLAPGVSLKSDAQKGTCMQATYDTKHIPLTVNVDGCHEVGGHYFCIAKSLPIFEVTSQFENPAILIVGAHDDVISAKEAKEYSECMKNCKYESLETLDHGLGGPEQSKMILEVVQFLTENV